MKVKILSTKMYTTKNKFRCNGTVGGVPGNRKGYCAKIGIVAYLVCDIEKNPRKSLCQSCFDKFMKQQESS